MAHKKGVGSSKNGRDSNPNRLGVKRADGQAIRAGSIIEKDMLIIRRPGHGIQPIDIDKVIGSKVKNDIEANQILYWEDIE